MCIVLDANMFGEFRDPANENMETVWNWLRKKNGKIAYSNTKKFEEEWERGGVTNLIKLLRQSGQLKEILPQGVEAKENELNRTGAIRSDDPHIIALAIIANVKVLVSNDKTLHEDFKNRNLVGGRVYQTKSHSRLLRKDMCP